MQNATIAIKRHTGSMGSEYTTLRLPPEEVAIFARLDWNTIARRVFIDPAAGLIALMSPSTDHETVGRGVDRLLDALGDAVGFDAVGLGSARWHGPGGPNREGRATAEPDCCFYLGETAEAYVLAALKGADDRRAFEARTPPDLVVEVERSHGDEDKPGFYRTLGVREMWCLDVDRNDHVSVEFLDLQAKDGPKSMGASVVPVNSSRRPSAPPSSGAAPNCAISSLEPPKRRPDPQAGWTARAERLFLGPVNITGT